MAAQKKNPDVETLTHALLSMIEPLVNVLDEFALDRPAAADTGHTIGAAADSGLKYLLDGMIRNVHRQIYGDLRRTTGEKIDNAKERCDKSSIQLNKLREKYALNEDEMFNDPDFLTAMKWLRINEERFLSYQGIYSALCNTYRETFNEDWKYVEYTRREPVPGNNARAERNAELRKQYMDRFKKEA